MDFFRDEHVDRVRDHTNHGRNYICDTFHTFHEKILIVNVEIGHILTTFYLFIATCVNNQTFLASILFINLFLVPIYIFRKLSECGLAFLMVGMPASIYFHDLILLEIFVALLTAVLRYDA